MLIFLTPHVIDDESDLEEVYRVKVAQRQEFIRRFYGKSRDAQEQELASILSYSMNQLGEPSQYRGKGPSSSNWEVIGSTSPAAQIINQSETTSEEESSLEIELTDEPSEENSESETDLDVEVDPETDTETEPRIVPEEE